MPDLRGDQLHFSFLFLQMTQATLLAFGCKGSWRLAVSSGLLEDFVAALGSEFGCLARSLK